jgi:hypothetical protein
VSVTLTLDEIIIYIYIYIYIWNNLLITIRSKISIKKIKILCIAGNAPLAAVLVGIQ